MTAAWSDWLVDVIRIVSCVLLGVLGLKVVAFVVLSYRHERGLDVVPTPVLSYKSLVSIIVPCFNEEAVVGNCIESLLATYYPNVEILVVDDASSGHTSEIASRFATTDPRVKVLEISKGGKAAALNHGLAHAQGDLG